MESKVRGKGGASDYATTSNYPRKPAAVIVKYRIVAVAEHHRLLGRQTGLGRQILERTGRQGTWPFPHDVPTLIDWI